MNSIISIHPYKFEGLWVFDDETAGLSQEPFVSGADDIIELLAADIPNAAAGFTLLFSANPFPGATAEFAWCRAEMGGNWYRCEAIGKEGWLCPALFKYFAEAPKHLYAQFREKRA